MVSFYTERTAEYSLVPAFSKILRYLGKVAPIFFWKTREGNTTSSIIHGADEVRVIALFARRPKIDIHNRDFLGMRINFSLYEFSERAKSVNIPVFCGLPMTRNIFELNEADCLWFHVDCAHQEEYMILDIENKERIYDAVPFLAKKEIIDIINKESVKMPWNIAMEAMRELNEYHAKEFGFLARFVKTTHYKPVYFLIKEE